jgi:hypothetical protein
VQNRFWPDRFVGKLPSRVASHQFLEKNTRASIRTRAEVPRFVAEDRGLPAQLGEHQEGIVGVEGRILHPNELPQVAAGRCCIQRPPVV